MRWGFWLNRAGIYAGLLALAAFSAFPLYWMAISSVKPFAELLSGRPTFWPSHVSWGFYTHLIKDSSFLLWLRSTLIITFGTVVLALIFAVLTGYGLARARFPGRRLVGRAILAGYMLPQILLVVPLFVAIVRFGLADTYSGVTLTFVTFTFPFAAWLLNAYFQTIPLELEEAARIDGASNASAFYRITLPLAAPGITAAAIFSFISGWNEFLYAFVIMNSEAHKTMAVGLYDLTSAGGEFSRWGDLMAASTMMVVPVIVFVLLVQRQIVSGLSAGAVKG